MSTTYKAIAYPTNHYHARPTLVVRRELRSLRSWAAGFVSGNPKSKVVVYEVTAGRHGTRRVKILIVRFTHEQWLGHYAKSPMNHGG